MAISNTDIKGRRVVVVHWKEKPNDPFQVFSNLKNFCASYPQYSYHTLNNYLSKEKKPYENIQIRIERKNILTKILKDQPEQKQRKNILTKILKDQPEQKQRSIVPVVRKGRLKDVNQDQEDLTYWLSKSVQDRAAAVTYLSSQTLKPAQRMDRSYVKKRKLKKR